VLSVPLALVALLTVAPPSAAEAEKCLKAAYPGVVCQVTAKHVVFCDGQKVPYEDGVTTKSHTARLETADVAEQLEQAYRVGPMKAPPAVDEEPGRIRSQAFFQAVYGKGRKAVARRTAKVRFMPRSGGPKLRMSTVGAVHDKLAAVGRALDRLPRAMRTMAAKVSGTFVHRHIRGTQRLSAHSYAIAIDVAVSKSDYWKWRKPDKTTGRYRYRNRIPAQIVEAFERHGFIWGGKWYRFDTMHFEYRPELVHPACQRPTR